jgi:hypothetical protein
LSPLSVYWVDRGDSPYLEKGKTMKAKKNYKETWRPTTPGSEGPKKSMPRKPKAVAKKVVAKKTAMKRGR